MKRFWISEDFRGHGYWTEAPNIAKAVERHGEDAIAISYRERGTEHVLILYPDEVFHPTASHVNLEIEYDRKEQKWYYSDGSHRFLLSLSRETISNLLFYSREMRHM